jgi:hypothetical protein
VKFLPAFFSNIAIGTLLIAAVRAEPTTSVVKFSDPAKTGTVKIAVARGDLRIHGSDSPGIVVKSEAQPDNQAPRKDGLRVLTSSSGFSLSEKDNVVTLDALGDGWSGGPSDLEVTVPRNANLILSNSLGGDIICSGVGGDIEVKSRNGAVRLDEVSGSALVETMNGEITANVRELHDNKPLSFTSMNGEVVIRVPADVKANVRLRTQNGSILTDFNEKALVTKVETNSRSSRHGGHPSGSTIITPELRQTIQQATRAGMEAAREAVQAAREAAEAAREAADEQRSASYNPPNPIPPRPPTMPAMPAIPTITGGKLVTGTLNGGGPEISVATMNGEVTLRRLDKN